MSCKDPLLNLTDIDLAIEPIGAEILAPFLALYSLVILMGLLGNMLVIVTLFSLRKTFSVTEVFILSLTVSDFLVISLNMPFQVSGLLGNYFF